MLMIVREWGKAIARTSSQKALEPYQLSTSSALCQELFEEAMNRLSITGFGDRDLSEKKNSGIDLSIHQDSSINDIQQKLQFWVQGVSGPEKRARDNAAQQLMAFCSKPHMRHIQLNSCQLTSLPDIFKASCFQERLENFILYNNRLTELPQQIGHFKALRYLSVGNNYLRVLPAEIFKLPHLKILYANANEIETLPNLDEGSSSLKKLDLSNNRLSQLPDSFAKLEAIRTLILYHNPIKTLPDWVQERVKNKKQTQPLLDAERDTLMSQLWHDWSPEEDRSFFAKKRQLVAS